MIEYNVTLTEENGARHEGQFFADTEREMAQFIANHMDCGLMITDENGELIPTNELKAIIDMVDAIAY